MHVQQWANCVWQVRVAAAEGEMQGGSRIVDLHNGLYEIFYTAPATGAFLVHVEYADAGLNPVPVGIRGSPFAVECRPLDQVPGAGSFACQTPGVYSHLIASMLNIPGHSSKCVP